MILKALTWFTGALVGAFIGAFTAELWGYYDIKEEWLTKAFNAGVERGVCVTVRALESAEAVDGCFTASARASP